jgi:hypothetical protein
VVVDVDVEVPASEGGLPVNTPGQTAMFFATVPASVVPVAIVIPQQKMVLSCPGDAQVVLGS